MEQPTIIINNVYETRGFFKRLALKMSNSINYYSFFLGFLITGVVVFIGFMLFLILGNKCLVNNLLSMLGNSGSFIGGTTGVSLTLASIFLILYTLKKQSEEYRVNNFKSNFIFFFDTWKNDKVEVNLNVLRDEINSIIMRNLDDPITTKKQIMNVCYSSSLKYKSIVFIILELKSILPYNPKIGEYFFDIFNSSFKRNEKEAIYFYFSSQRLITFEIFELFIRFFTLMPDFYHRLERDIKNNLNTAEEVRKHQLEMLRKHINFITDCEFQIGQ